MPEPVQLRPSPEPGFDEFWKLYPCKREKVLCRMKWDAITNGGLKTRMLDRSTGEFVQVELAATAAEILAGLKAFIAKIPRKPNSYEYLEPQFIPHPITWLNRGRWVDES